MEDDPWGVSKLEDFLHFCCPECDFKEITKEEFVKHALHKHPNAKTSLLSLIVKEEDINESNIIIDKKDNNDVDDNINDIEIKHDIQENSEKLFHENLVEYQIKEEIDQEEVDEDHYFEDDFDYSHENNTDKKYKCEFCEKSYTSTGALRYHLIHVHEGKKIETKKFKCKYCQKIYSGRSPLKYHISRCHNGNPHEEFQLEQDFDLEYNDMENLDTTTSNDPHEDTSNNKKYKCEFCEKSYSGPSPLKYHIDTVHTNSNKFECKFCDWKTPIASKLQYHVEMKHGSSGSKRFQCPNCAKGYPIPSLLKYHLITAHELDLDGVNNFKCGSCDENNSQYFSNVDELITHMSNEHSRTLEEYETNELKCDYCEKVCENLDEFVSHIKTNHAEKLADKKYKCDFCEKAYTSTGALKYHLEKVHEGKKMEIKKFPYKTLHFRHTEKIECPKCGKKVYGLNKHMLNCTWTGSLKKYRKNYPCELCDNVYMSLRKLNDHVKCFHEGEKEYSCHMCGKQFTQTHTLKSHILTVHEGRKDHICNHCSKPFGMAKNLLAHIKSVHEKLKPHLCVTCGKSYAHSNALNYHVKAVHKKIRNFPCKLCEKSYFNSTALNNHVRSFHEGYKFPCKFCENTFGCKESLRRHKKAVHPSEIYKNLLPTN